MWAHSNIIGLLSSSIIPHDDSTVNKQIHVVVVNIIIIIMSTWNTIWCFKQFSTKSVNKHCPERSTKAIYEARQCMQCWKFACQIKPLCSRTQLIDWYLLPMCQALNQRFAGIQTKKKAIYRQPNEGQSMPKQSLVCNSTGNAKYCWCYRQCQILLKTVHLQRINITHTHAHK